MTNGYADISSKHIDSNKGQTTPHGQQGITTNVCSSIDACHPQPKNSFAIADLCPLIIKKSAPARFTGAIFDLDGTLIDSMPYWQKLGPSYLADRKKTPLPDAARKFNELTVEEVAIYMKETYALTESTDEIANDLIAGIEQAYRFQIPLKPGVSHMLEALDKAGIRMCIATASEKDLAIAVLKRLNVVNHFCGIYTCPEVGVSKGQPDVFEWALRELGTPRDTTLVFEDSLHAIKTAKQAGFPVIAVLEQSALNDKDAIVNYADAVIDSFETMSR